MWPRATSFVVRCHCSDYLQATAIKFKLQVEYRMSQSNGGKLRLMVVDDEPDNLDLLYRTFRRDFEVFKANSGLNALQTLDQEGEMAIIISD
ncbi:MAG TPA: hypothetical protein V6D04_05415, partial [Candidatus Obscuribacterales bacterium]